MLVAWSRQAADDLLSQVDYIRRENPIAAERVERDIIDAVLSLSLFPHRGRPGRQPGTRQLLIRRRYLVVYPVVGEQIEVVRIFHGSQNRP